jgi:hypothetical protein
MNPEISFLNMFSDLRIAFSKQTSYNYSLKFDTKFLIILGRNIDNDGNRVTHVISVIVDRLFLEHIIRVNKYRNVVHRIDTDRGLEIVMIYSLGCLLHRHTRALSIPISLG